ncbi:MAG: AraC family transcriptional regulator [Pseudomonadota bacterium]
MNTNYEVFGRFDMTVLALPTQLFETAHASLGSTSRLDLEVLHTQMLRSAFASELVNQLSNEARAGNPNSALFVDHLVHVLAGTLLRLADGVSQSKSTTGQPLDDAAFRAVNELIADQLCEKVTLTDLASRCGLDVYRFTRAFKARTGTTPHQFLTNCRIDRAQQMLRHGTEPLADIAYACGFASQAHMTTTFSKHVGTTPGRYRNEVQG